MLENRYNYADFVLQKTIEDNKKEICDLITKNEFSKVKTNDQSTQIDLINFENAGFSPNPQQNIIKSK